MFFYNVQWSNDYGHPKLDLDSCVHMHKFDLCAYIGVFKVSCKRKWIREFNKGIHWCHKDF